MSSESIKERIMNELNDFPFNEDFITEIKEPCCLNKYSTSEPCPGVYIFSIYDTSSKEDKYIYVGKSICNISGRIEAHKWQWQHNTQNYELPHYLSGNMQNIYITEIRIKQWYYYIAPSLELFLINKLKPELNIEGKYYSINPDDHIVSPDPNDLCVISTFKWYCDDQWYNLSSSEIWKKIYKVLSFAANIFEDTSDIRRMTRSIQRTRHIGFTWNLPYKNAYFWMGLDNCKECCPEKWYIYYNNQYHAIENTKKFNDFKKCIIDHMQKYYKEISG